MRARTYVVERWLPGLTARHRRELQAALAEASRRLSASGAAIRYLGSLFVPADSRSFCFFEATTVETVRRANDVALVPFTSVEEAIWLPQGGPDARNR